MEFKADEGFKQALQSIENSFKNSKFYVIFKSTVDMKLKLTTTKSLKLNSQNCKMKSFTSNIFDAVNLLYFISVHLINMYKFYIFNI